MTKLEKLLTLANSSPFEGEKQNAMDAVKRVLRKREEIERRNEKLEWFEPCLSLYDYYIMLDKERRAISLARARELGLDARSTPRKVSYKNKTVAQFMRDMEARNKRREPFDHAEVLMKETLMDLAEISSITGLNMDALKEIQE